MRERSYAGGATLLYRANVSRDLLLRGYKPACNLGHKLIGRWDHMITYCGSSTMPESNDA